MAVGTGGGGVGGGDSCCSGRAVLRLWHRHGDGSLFIDVSLSAALVLLLVAVGFAGPRREKRGSVSTRAWFMLLRRGEGGATVQTLRRH